MKLHLEIVKCIAIFLYVYYWRFLKIDIADPNMIF